MEMLERIISTAIIIALWERFFKDFITWDGFGTPFRRKNRKPNAEADTPNEGSEE